MPPEHVRKTFNESALRILGNLPNEASLLLHLLINRGTSLELEQSLLVLFICQQYASCWSADRIAEHINKAGFFPKNVDHDRILRQLVLPVRRLFLACELNVEEYWDAGKPWLDFLFYECHCRQAKGESGQAIASDLTRYWALHRTPFFLDAIGLRKTFTASSVNAVTNRAIEIATDNKKKTSLVNFFKKYNRSISSSLRQHSLLLKFAKANAAIFFLHKATKECGDMPEPLSHELNKYSNQLKIWIRSFYFWELAIIFPDNKDTTIIKQTLRLVRITKRESGNNALGIEIGGPVDTINGKEYVPSWIRDYIFSAGGRFSQNSIGPIAYLQIAFEQGECDFISNRIGLCEPEISEDELLLPMQIDDGSKDPLYVSFRFSLSYPESLRTLMLAVCTQCFRLDLLRTDKGGDLSLIGSFNVELPEAIVRTLRNTALQKLRDNFRNSPECVREAMAAQMSEPVYGFLQYENAKSLEVMLETASLPTRIPDSCKELWLDFARIRERVLRLEKQRVNKLELNDMEAAQSTAQRLVIQRKRLKVIEQKLRGRDQQGVDELLSKASLETIAEVLGSSDRCFAHLGFERGDLKCCYLFAHDGKVQVSEIVFPEWDLDKSLRVVNGWLEAKTERDAKSSLSKMLQYLGKTVGNPIHLTLSRSGIRHLVVSPSWFLLLIPLHCLSLKTTGGDVCLMDSFDSLTYAPSLRFLHRNKAPHPGGDRTVYAYSPCEDPLPCVNIEAQLVSHFMSNSRMVVGKRATPNQFLRTAVNSSFIHAACHGDWVPHDPLQSSLVLSNGRQGNSLLSAARIQADGDFKNVSLVTLSACDTGRFFQPSHTFQEYRGIDGIFMAKGARAVISTLWSVDDVAAALVMSRMYYELSRNETIDHALSIAVKQLRRGFLENMPQDPAFSMALDQYFSEWRKKVRLAGESYKHPITWGAFRASGITWIAI
jgi:CHAT domain-containing protein